MEFKVEGKPVLVTSEDTERTIQHGWVADDPLRPGQLLLCATNAYTFVRIPIGAPPKGFEHAKGMVPKAALAFAADNPGFQITLAERHVMVGRDASFRREQGLAFPDLTNTLPADPTKPMRFAIDTTLLANLAEAMGTQRVELIFDLDLVTAAEGSALYNKAVLVRRMSIDGKGQEVVPDGIIMPVRVEPGGAPPPARPPEGAASVEGPAAPPEAAPAEPAPPAAEQPPPAGPPPGQEQQPPEHPPPPPA